MITGCNTNVLYRGKQFHVQTEDSGRENPHIISHIYHGGTIIASEKSEYGDRIDAEELDNNVRAQIEFKHNAMLKRFKGGVLDALIDERVAGAAASAKPSPPPASEKQVAGSVASAADTSGSVTSGAATHPSIDLERPVPETRPILDGASTPGFGDSADSEKPLDEVILDYLVDKARGRAAEKKQSPPRQKRDKG
jgi:hypothetical protein